MACSVTGGGGSTCFNGAVLPLIKMYSNCLYELARSSDKCGSSVAAAACNEDIFTCKCVVIAAYRVFHIQIAFYQQRQGGVPIGLSDDVKQAGSTAPSSITVQIQSFGRSYCLHLQSRRTSESIRCLLLLGVEDEGSSLLRNVCHCMCQYCTCSLPLQPEVTCHVHAKCVVPTGVGRGGLEVT
jgi:hypothetical protein